MSFTKSWIAEEAERKIKQARYEHALKLCHAAFAEVYKTEWTRFYTYNDPIYVHDLILKRGPDPKFRKSKWPKLYVALIKVRLKG